MTRDKITLSQLETFLFKSADILLRKMDASESKEFIFGLLFLTRLSDKFDRKRRALKKEYSHLADQPELLAELLKDKSTYGETFFVPVRARWNDVALYGQDSNGTVWSIYVMNISKMDKMIIGNPHSTREQAGLSERLVAQANAVLELKLNALKLRKLKAALMQDLLPGRTRVTEFLPD